MSGQTGFSIGAEQPSRLVYLLPSVTSGEPTILRIILKTGYVPSWAPTLLRIIFSGDLESRRNEMLRNINVLATYQLLAALRAFLTA